MKNSITIRKIETIKYFINEFVILNIYIFELINDKIEMIEIIVKVHLVCNFKVKFLVVMIQRSSTRSLVRLIALLIMIVGRKVRTGSR